MESAGRGPKTDGLETIYRPANLGEIQQAAGCTPSRNNSSTWTALSTLRSGRPCGPNWPRTTPPWETAGDATVCWINALWEEGDRAAQTARRWACAENDGTAGSLSGVDLDALLAAARPSPSEVRRLAAHLFWAGHREPSQPALRKRLGAIQHFLAGHEDLLPVRAVWLAWHGLSRLAHGDVLALARARDRLLERLFKHGLSPELDLPGFLRFSGNRNSERLRTFRGWLAALPERIRRWIHQTHKNTEANAGDTEAYAVTSILLAFGFRHLRRLAESRAGLGTHELRNRARALLGGRGGAEADVHHFLREAFEYRIAQALDGKPAVGSLPPEQLEYLEVLEREDAGQEGRTSRYKADRLRQHSRILEPHRMKRSTRIASGISAFSTRWARSWLPLRTCSTPTNWARKSSDCCTRRARRSRLPPGGRAS